MASLKYVGRIPSTDLGLMNQSHVDGRFQDTSITQQTLDELVVPRTADLVLPSYVQAQDALLARKSYVDQRDGLYQLRSTVGQPNGIASLGSDAKIPPAQVSPPTDYAPLFHAIPAEITGTSVVTGTGRILARGTLPDPGFPYVPLVFGQVMARSDNDWSRPRVDVVLSSSGSRIAMGFGTETRSWDILKSLPVPPGSSTAGLTYSGPLDLLMMGYRHNGGASVSYSPVNFQFLVVAVPAL